MNHRYTLGNSSGGISRESRGLRNRRQSDLSWGNNGCYENRRSTSSQESDYECRSTSYSTDITRDDCAPQFASNSRSVRHRSKQATTRKQQRVARSISVAITTAILLYLCYWTIETGVVLVRSSLSSFTNGKVEDEPLPPPSTDTVREKPITTKSEDRGLRGIPDRMGGHSAANKHHTKEKDREQTTGMNLGQNLGKDATLDFFYAGKFIHKDDGTQFGSASVTAYSYATLPLSDCNPFVLSVWIYLSPESERRVAAEGSDNDKPPRVILSTKTRQFDGCISDLFDGSTSDSSKSRGMVLYAQPHFGDRTGDEQTAYKIMVDYAVANEMRCRTLVSDKTTLIREGEWHHVVLFVSRVSVGELSANQGVERMSLYIDGDLVVKDERISNRLCSNAHEPKIAVGRYESPNSNNKANSEESRFCLDGRIGMLAYWETGGPEVFTKQSDRMQVHTIRDEEHVVRAINRARFDMRSIKDLPHQGLSVKEPDMLYTFDEQGDIRNHTKLLMAADIREVMSGLHNGKTEILSPFMKAAFEFELDEQPFVPLGGNRFAEYRDGMFIPPEPSSIELRQQDELARARSLRIKEAMIHLWSGYKKYAWGRDELLPLSQGGQDNWGGTGTTLVDSLSTLWLMGMKDEFWEARNWIKDLNFNNVSKAVSVFETTIRTLGALISSFDLSGDKLFLNKADDLGTRLMKAFNSPSGVPYGEVELSDGGRAFNTDWHPSSAALAEIGTLQVEFRYLAHATGKTEYATASMRALDELLKLQTESGLYPTLIHNLKSSLSFANNDISIGAMGDSFYEYLLKIWLQGGKQETFYRNMYDKAVEGIMQKLVCRRNGLTYVAELKDGKLDHKMDHLSCFLGGNLALGAFTHPDGLDSEQAQKQLITGKQLAYTCYQMYARSNHGLPPEYVKFGGTKDDFTAATDAPYYILRPETTETLFILHHLTKDNVYREWSWEIFRAIDKSCRTEAGYAALRNVNTAKAPQQNNRMESFFPAETLKYLYLIQDNSQIDLLNTHVFNTEAHPLRQLDKIPFKAER